MKTLEEIVRVSLSLILAGGLIPMMGLLIRQIPELAYKKAWIGLGYCCLVPAILGIQIFLIAWLAAPYGNYDSPQKHLSTCATRINGLWLPGKQCTCGARYVQPCNCKNDGKYSN
jgi:hypothetical protein